MKRKVKNPTAEITIETSEVLVNDHRNKNQNSFDALSEFGMVCGTFLGTLGVSLALIISFFDSAMQLKNISIMLIFFSLIMFMIGTGNTIKIKEEKKRSVAR